MKGEVDSYTVLDSTVIVGDFSTPLNINTQWAAKQVTINVKRFQSYQASFPITMM